MIGKDVSEYLAGLREREQARRRLDAARRERLWAALPAAVQCLVAEFGVSQVTLFGSVARDQAGLDSDVDLLVTGLPAERLFEATARVSRLLGADVDLVPAETVRPDVLTRAREEGRVLHG
jgi:predicted nucleotidyltransferase